MDAKEKARVPPLELRRILTCVRHVVAGVESVEHPTDRSLAIGRPLGIDRSGDDQPVDRASHRHVVEAQALSPLLLALGLAYLLEVEDRSPLAVRRVHHAEPEASVGERDDLASAARPADVSSGVGNDHDLELETLCTVDREQAHGIRSLFLRDRFELPRTERVLLADETDEAGKVGAADRLVLTGEATELPQVRESARAVPAGENRQVVVVLGEDLLAQPFETHTGRCCDEPVVSLEKRAQQPLVLGGEVLGQPTLERREKRPPGRVPADQDEGVVGDPHQRRRQDGGERDVVVAVVQEPEIREQVDDLLLPEIPAPGRPEGREPLQSKRLLVALGVRPGGEEHDDLARQRRARIDQLAHTRRNCPSLSVAPVLARVAVAHLVRDHQLDRMPEDRVGELRRRREGLVLVAEGTREEEVHGREHLRS